MKKINKIKNKTKQNKTKQNKTKQKLSKLIKGLRGHIQINKTRNEKGDITTESEQIKKTKSSGTTTYAYTQQNWKI